MTINKDIKPQVIITDDGSSTIYLPELDETYHSKFGAVNEAMHVFIENGLAKSAKKEINVLEIGFGTGLNAILTLLYANNNQMKVNYTTLEKYPLNKETIALLNYKEEINGADKFFTKIHELEWEKSHQITLYFNLKKIKIDALNNSFLFPKNIDLIYFDAFAPSKQAELWNESLFKKLHDSLRNDGKLVTYSAAGMVKQALRSAGFKVKRLPGPPGKHHMIFSSKL